MTDYTRQETGITSPTFGGVEITPSNDNDLARVTRGLYVGVTGNVKVDMEDGSTITWVGLAAGMIHPIRAKRVYATLTTATSIIGVY